MISYEIEGCGTKMKLDTHEEIMDLLIKFKDKHPDFNYDISLEAHKGNLEWKIILNIENEKVKTKISGESAGAHDVL